MDYPEGKLPPSYDVAENELPYQIKLALWQTAFGLQKVDGLSPSEYMVELAYEHIEGKRDNSRKVWTVCMFCLWYELYVEGKSISELEFKSDFNKNGDMCRLA